MERRDHEATSVLQLFHCFADQELQGLAVVRPGMRHGYSSRQTRVARCSRVDALWFHGEIPGTLLEPLGLAGHTWGSQQDDLRPSEDHDRTNRSRFRDEPVL